MLLPLLGTQLRLSKGKRTKHTGNRNSSSESVVLNIKQQLQEKTRLELKTRLDKLKPALNITKYEEWYQVSYEKLVQVDPSISYYLYKRGAGSIPESIAAAYPEHEWKLWMFSRPPRGYWEDPSNRRKVLESVMSELGISSREDWYNVTNEQFAKTSGQPLLQKYYGSVRLLLEKEFSEHSWQPWRFQERQKAANAQWQSSESQREIFEWVLMNEIKGSSLHDWYSTDANSIQVTGFRSILANSYGGNLQRALAAIYPEHEWRPWLFKRKAGSKIWSDPSTIRAWISWVCKIKGVQSLLELSEAEISALHGASLLRRFGSVQGLLDAAHGEKSTSPSILDTESPKSLSEKLRTDIVDLGLRLGSDRAGLEAFYVVSDDDLKKLEPLSKSNFIKTLKSVYPQHSWQTWRFRALKARIPSTELRDPRVQKQFFDLAAQEMRLTKMEHWYLVTFAQISRLGGRPFLAVFNDSLSSALVSVYPEHQWDLQMFKKRKTKDLST